MRVDDLIQRPGGWLSMGSNSGVAISGRIRLARNISGVAFPGWAGQEECVRISHVLFDAFSKIDRTADALCLHIEQLDPVDKLILQERHLISNELTLREAGSGVVVTHDERVSVMINEEDHLRLQVIMPGMDLAMMWEQVDALDTALEEHLHYAFDPEVGYLTACPTNVGTGMRASVMVHLPALNLIGEVESVIKGLSKIGLAVRGMLGEGTEAWGNMYQISNQVTLGESEENIITRLGKIVSEVIEHEQNARARLIEGCEERVRDLVGRSYGLLTQAYLVSSREALDLLSGLRLGIEMNMIKGADVGLLNELILLTQPGHLQRIMKQTIGPGERDAVRARIMREKLCGVTV